MFRVLPSSPVRRPISAVLLGTTMLVSLAQARAADAFDEVALRDVVRAAYIRGGQSRTDAEIDALANSARPLVAFDPRRATEADIVGLVGRLGLTDASLPPPPPPVTLSRTLAAYAMPAYEGADLTGKSAAELAGMLQRGETTSREIVLQYMYRTQKYDHAGPALRSVIELNPDLLTIADQMDARRVEARAKGETLPELFGIPVLVKDNIGTADGLRTTAGSYALLGSKVEDDAPLIKQLREQGAIIMGKANMSEWACFRVGCTDVIGGQPRNPYDPAHYPVAGSSTGSGIAAAMRFAPVTLGTETNGSIIGPSLTSHVYALKPTQGMVSRTGVIPGYEALDTVGALGNSVKELALLLGNMNARDTSDPLSAAYDGVRTKDYASMLGGDLTGIRIGIKADGQKATSTDRVFLSEEQQQDYNRFLGDALASSNAQVKYYTTSDVGLALKSAVNGLSDRDMDIFYVTLMGEPLPTDTTRRQRVLGYLFSTSPDQIASLLGDFTAQAIATTAEFQIRKYLDANLGGRVASQADYESAFVRLLGDKFKALGGGVRSVADVVKFNALNPSLEPSSSFDNFVRATRTSLEEQAQAAGFDSVAEFDKRIEDLRRITAALMASIRQSIGVDALLDDDVYNQNTFAWSMSPQISIPVTVKGATLNILADADPYREDVLLKIGDYVERQLRTPDFTQYRAAAPTVSDTPAVNTYEDKGPLLPLVLNDLDDHGRATKAHLLSTEMAPLVLNATSADKLPWFDGRISGNGGLIKDGAGVQTLTGTSDFTGNVQVWRGGLAVDRTEALGAIANTVTLENRSALIATRSFTLGRDVMLRDGGTLGVLDGATLVQDKVVSGNGGLAKTGGGRLTLLAANTYTGGTDIREGTVSVSREENLGQAYGAVTIGDDAILAATASFTTTRPIALTGVSGIAVSAEATLTATNTVSGAGSLAKLDLGTLTLTGTNLYAGGTVIAGGTLSVSQEANLGAVTGGLAFDGGVLKVTGTEFSATGRSVALRQGGGGFDIAEAANLFTVSGPISGAGGLVKLGAGTLALSGTGRIGGAIRNQAGRFDVGGVLSSDASFVNAAGATLSVSGSYSLAGMLTNLGTLAVAGGGRFRAGDVVNAGTLTVAANASVVDDLFNTGTVDNAGSYTADATNAAGATLTNTGTFSTVSRPFANAGTLVTTGVLDGGLSNSGTARVSGGLNGAVDNTGLIRLTGTTTGIGRLTNDGTVDLGATALSVGSLAGGTAAALIGNGRLTVGADDSSTSYAGQIVDGGGTTSLTKVGAGTLTLSGASAFSGLLSVLGGGLSVTGSLAGTPVGLGAGTLLSGQGSFASLTAAGGSTVAPGTAPDGLGQITVVGNLAFAPGSTYRVDATADGRSDRIVAGGRATLTGAAVQAVAGSGQYAPRTRYTILSAGGGLSGQFTGVSANFAFLTPFLNYDPNDVYLTLARNDLDFRAVAQTRNQRAAAQAVQAGAVGSPLYDAVSTLSAPQARAAFAALSGDAHASLTSTAFATAGLLRETVLDRLRRGTAGLPEDADYGTLPATYTADLPGRPAAVASVPARVFDPRVFGLWGQGFGSTGRVQTDGNAAGLSRSTGGFVLGADAHLGDGLRLGLAGGYRSTSFNTSGSAESGTVDGVFGGLYGDYRAGPVSVRFGALAADDGVRLRRLVAFPGFSGNPSACTGGTTIQGFGEIGYRIGLGAEGGWSAAMLEPFAGGAAVAIRRDRFAEQGGPAALGGAAQEDTIPVSNVGVRGQATLDLGAGVTVLAQGLVGYRHAFGDVTPVTRLTVLGTGAGFASAGLPIDRHALVVEAGLSAQVASNATLGVSYTGQVGPRAQDHGARADFTLRF